LTPGGRVGGLVSVFSFPGKSDALKSFKGHGKASNKPEVQLKVTLLEIPKKGGRMSRPSNLASGHRKKRIYCRERWGEKPGDGESGGGKAELLL
jgi:hypothetical protein